MDENFLDEAMECYKDGVDRRMSIVAASVEHYGYGRLTRIRRSHYICKEDGI